MNGINEIIAINAWRSSPEFKRLRKAIATNGQPYEDERAGQSFTLDGEFKVYKDGARIKV